MRSNFRDLVAYQRAAELADDIYLLVKQWPRVDQFGLGIQLVRAVDSIGANIAEASGRWHGPDKRRLLVIARGSLYEAEHWLNAAARRGLLDEAISDRLDEVARALSGMIKQPAPS